MSRRSQVISTCAAGAGTVLLLTALAVSNRSQDGTAQIGTEPSASQVLNISVPVQSEVPGLEPSLIEKMTVADARNFDDFALFYLGIEYDDLILSSIELREESGAHARELIGFAGKGTLPIRQVLMQYTVPGLDGPESQGVEVKMSPISGYVFPYDEDDENLGLEPVVVANSNGLMADQGDGSYVVIERDGVQIVVYGMSGEQALAAARELTRMN